MPSLHLEAEKGEIAKSVLMPGDPIRAQIMSEKMLENARMVNRVRNMFGFTGDYQGQKASIISSGMGIPSMGIYSYELFHFYDVDRIVRVGTCGSISEHIGLGEIILAQSISTDSNYVRQFRLDGTYAPCASWPLLRKAAAYCDDRGLTYEVGNTLCSDSFYYDDEASWKKWAKMNVLAIEMESLALYANAARAGKQALSILTVSDHIPSGKRASVSERETSFSTMFEIALAAIF